MRSSRRWEGVGLVLVTLALAWSGPLGAQSPHPWSLGLQAGQAANHGSPYEGRFISFALGRDMDRRGLMRWRVEVGESNALGNAFGFVRAAPELRLLPGSPVTPYATASAGFLEESEYFGFAFAAGGGLVAALGPRVAVRAELTRGTHGGEPGPHALTAGAELRLGRPRATS